MGWVESAGWCEMPLDRFTIQVVHRVNGENWPVDWWSIWKRWNWSGSDDRGDLWVDWQLNRRQACISPQPESAIEPRPLRPPGVNPFKRWPEYFANPSIGVHFKQSQTKKIIEQTERVKRTAAEISFGEFARLNSPVKQKPLKFALRKAQATSNGRDNSRLNKATRVINDQHSPR